MPSTRRQKAKARKSKEMDMLSDMDNLDVMIGSENPLERELADVIDQSSINGDMEIGSHSRNDLGNFIQGNEPHGRNDIRQSFETFSNEFNLRLSQEMDSMMAMVHSQINRAISTAISEKVLPEIQNIVSSMSSSGNRDTEMSMSPSSQENRENPSGLKTKLLKKDSRSVGDLRDTTGRGSYTSATMLKLIVIRSNIRIKRSNVRLSLVLNQNSVSETATSQKKLCRRLLRKKRFPVARQDACYFPPTYNGGKITICVAFIQIRRNLRSHDLHPVHLTIAVT